MPEGDRDEGSISWEAANVHHEQAHKIIENETSSLFPVALVHALLAIDHRLVAIAHDAASGEFRGSFSG